MADKGKQPQKGRHAAPRGNKSSEKDGQSSDPIGGLELNEYGAICTQYFYFDGDIEQSHKDGAGYCYNVFGKPEFFVCDPLDLSPGLEIDQRCNYDGDEFSSSPEQEYEGSDVAWAKIFRMYQSPMYLKQNGFVDKDGCGGNLWDQNPKKPV